MVRSCVSASTRLWTCIKSIVLVCRRANERCIESIPACWPRVQTLVARKSESRSLSLVRRSPMTCSARPYMGEESMTRPPSFTKALRTSASGADCARSTSKVCHVPNPMTGSFSPDEGIERISIVADSFLLCAPTAPIGQRQLAAIPPIKRAASRRVISRVMLSKVETSLVVI